MSKPKERYTDYNKIGSGTYGVVYSAIDANTGEKVAIKKLKPDQEDEGLSSTTIREVSLLTELRHPNIISLNEVSYTDGRLFLVFEFLEQDLHQFLTTAEGLISPKLVKSFLFQLLAGTVHAHEKRILHRDLKPQNLLINKNGVLKIADFGLARAFTIPCRVYTHEVVTLWYRAPELLLGSRQYGSPLDMWSIGCIFYELATKEPLFPGECEWGQMMKIFKLLGTPNDGIWKGCEDLPDYVRECPQFRPQPLSSRVPKDPQTGLPALDEMGIDLLSKMLTYDPGKRITPAQALNHPYFDSIMQHNKHSQLQRSQMGGKSNILQSLIVQNRHNVKKSVENTGSLSNPSSANDEVIQGTHEHTMTMPKRDNNDASRQKAPLTSAILDFSRDKPNNTHLGDAHNLMRDSSAADDCKEDTTTTTTHQLPNKTSNGKRYGAKSNLPHHGSDNGTIPIKPTIPNKSSNQVDMAQAKRQQAQFDKITKNTKNNSNTGGSS